MDQRFHAIASDLSSRILVLRDGQTLFRQGQKPNAIYFVESGTVRLLRQLKDGATAVMHVAREGEWVAESSLFSERYHCQAVAIGQTRLRAVNKQSILSLLGRKPDLCLALAKELATHLRDLRTSHEVVRIRRAPDRLLAWMQINSQGNPSTVVVDGTWTQVAEELAMTREALYRALASLRRAGVITVEAKTVVLARLRH